MRKKLYGFYTGFVEINEKQQTLTELNLDCDFVQLSLWTVLDNKTDTTKPDAPAFGQTPQTQNFIFWGFNSNCGIQHFAGQDPFLIPVRSTRDIYVRATTGQTTKVFFNCYKYEVTEETTDEEKTQ